MFYSDTADIHNGSDATVLCMTKCDTKFSIDSEMVAGKCVWRESGEGANENNLRKRLIPYYRIDSCSLLTMKYKYMTYTIHTNTEFVHQMFDVFYLPFRFWRFLTK